MGRARNTTEPGPWCRQSVAEPYLVREGFMVRTPRGRAATRRAWEHLHLTPPVGSTTQDVLPLDDGPGRLGSATD